jgi:integrase
VSVVLAPEQVAALRALLATVDSRSAEDQSGGVLADNRIADGDGTLEGNPMCKVYGPYEDKGKFRVMVIDTVTKKKSNRLFATEALARSAIPKLTREYRRPVGVMMTEALEQYRQHLTTKGNRSRSIDTTVGRVQSLFTVDVMTGELSPELAARAWERFRTTNGPRSGKTPSVDTQVGVLKQCKTFLRWCQSKAWLNYPDPLQGIEVQGKRKRGKPKFQAIEDDSRRFLAKGLELARAGDVGATAAVTALVLGMRASEIAGRVVGDLDDGARKLAIPYAKTDAGIRRLLIPDVLQPLVVALARDKGRDAKLFGPKANRHWVLRAVWRVCKAAGVKVISAHGLRGVHAELAVDAGITGEVVAASLGHESFQTTARHYAGADAVSGARVARVVDALN